MAVLVILFGVISNQESPADWPISDVAEAVQQGRIQKIVVTDNDRLSITLTNGDQVRSNKDASGTAYEQLVTFGVTAEQIAQIEWVNQKATNWQTILTALLYLAPLVIVLVLIYAMMRQAGSQNNQAINFGKSRARMFSGDQPTVTFADVAGCDEAKQELSEVVEFLREPAKFIQLGARIPKGVLLVGPPGTGKTLMAKAVAGEAGSPFFSISGSEFVEMFVGVGASRVRDLFEQAKRHSPCIVFVDEIDAVGRHRGAGLGGSHDEREQTLNQILVEMDGFDTDTNVIIVAATNRPDILDPALLRPGRFDRRVVIDHPDVRGREAIFDVHVKGKPLNEDVELTTLAKSTPGFVGADIENTVNEAAILAARQNKKNINMVDFMEAIDRVVMGPERRSRLMTVEERRLTAYHEAGHAVVAHLLPNCDRVVKVTIVPRGMAGGYTRIADEDVRYRSRSKFMDDIAMALGGRVAEELTFDEITTGAYGDLQNVTRAARSMVTQYGMSERLGPMMYGQKQELVFLGREIGEQRDYSESVATEIDEEVRAIISEAYERARSVILENRERFEAVAETLLEVETLTHEQFTAIMNGEKLDLDAIRASSGPSKAQPVKDNTKEVRKSSEDSASGLVPPEPAPA
jgi:cell division protease FtsH